MKVKSQSQARFLGSVASGNAGGKVGLTAAKAGKMLKENRGMKMRGLPERVPTVRAPRRVSTRGHR